MAAPEPVRVTWALGIISAPPFRSRRDVIRSTWLAEVPPQVVVRFVLRTGGRCATSRIKGADTFNQSYIYSRPSPSRSTRTRNTASQAPPPPPDDDKERSLGDVVTVPGVCTDASRWQGAVPSIYAWIRHAVLTWPNVSFIGRTDDDLWFGLAAFQPYLDLVAARFDTSAEHVLLGNLLFTSWLVGEREELDSGFGYTCLQARGAFNARLRPHLSRMDNVSSDGPTTFATGYLVILSHHLAAAVAESKALAQRMAAMQAASGSWGLEDKYASSLT